MLSCYFLASIVYSEKSAVYWNSLVSDVLFFSCHSQDFLLILTSSTLTLIYVCRPLCVYLTWRLLSFLNVLLFFSKFGEFQLLFLSIFLCIFFSLLPVLPLCVRVSHISSRLFSCLFILFLFILWLE